MQGFEPIGLVLSDDGDRQIGLAVQRGLAPGLTAIDVGVSASNRNLNRLERRLNNLQIVFAHLPAATANQRLGIVAPVFVANLGFLETVAVIGMAIGIIIVVILLEMFRQLQWVNTRLGRLLIMIDQLAQLQAIAVAQLAASVMMLGLMAAMLGLLEAILAAISSGILISGTIVFEIVLDTGGSLDLWELILQLTALASLLPLVTGALGLLTAAVTALAGAVALLAGALKLMPDNLGSIVDSLLKLGAGILALAVVIGLIAAFRPDVLIAIGLSFLGIVVFLALLAGALRLFNDQALKAIPALKKLFIYIGALALAISLFSKEKLIQIGLSFLGIALFIGALGLALRLFTAEGLKAIPALKELFEAIVQLGQAIAGFTEEQLKQIAMGFAGIALFMAALGLALMLFNAETLKAVPGLKDLFEGLIKLAETIAGFTEEQLIQIAKGFAGIALFIAALGLALMLFNAETLAAVPGLKDLFEGLIQLGDAIASYTPDELIQIGLGLLGIVVFVALLGLALSLFSQQAIEAMPALGQLLESLGGLVTVVANLSGGQLIVLGIGLAMLAAFLFAVAGALMIATPGLIALEGVLARLQGIMNTVAQAAGKLASAISSIPSPSFSLPSLPSFQGGGVMPHTGLALVHAGERVLTSEETAAFDRFGGAGLVAGGGGAGAAGGADQSVHIEGGIHVNVQADSVDRDAVGPLSDEIVSRIQERLANLRTTQRFRTGVRATPQPA